MAVKIEPASPALGALGGLLMHQRHGVPTWFVIAALGVALAFGMIAAAMRPRDPEERRERVRIAPYNAGALFVLAGATVWQADLALPGALMTALVLGLLGTGALEMAEQKWRGGGVTAEELDQRLGDERSRVAAVFAEAAIDKHKDESE